LDTVQSYDDNAVVAHTPGDHLHHYACASTVVTLQGTIDNDSDLRQWTLGNAPPLSSAAELIAKLYRQRKYHVRFAPRKRRLQDLRRPISPPRPRQRNSPTGRRGTELRRRRGTATQRARGILPSGGLAVATRTTDA
jgi:hypothetical protein